MTTATNTAHRYERESVEFARTFAFLDAVYAIALTLLVVNIDPPEASAWRSLSTTRSSRMSRSR